MIEYPDLLRIRYDHISPAHGKRYFDEIGSYKDLFKQEVVVTEKVDGSQMAVGWKNDQPYIQAKNSHIPQMDKRKAYYGVWSWAWKNITRFEKLKGHLVFGEWVRVQHSLPYDDLPDWFIAFDVWDNIESKFLDFEEGQRFASSIGFSTIPVIYRGYLKYPELPELVEARKSNFSTSQLVDKTKFDDEERFHIRNYKVGDRWVERFADGNIFMEGCVVKPTHRPRFEKKKKTTYWTNSAKLVVQEFLDEFEEDSHWTSHRMRENILHEWNKSREDS